MNILLVSNLYPPGFIGGYELAARDVARMLVRRGHSVTVLSSPALDGAPDLPEPVVVVRSMECAGITPDVLRPREQRIRGLYFNLKNLDALRAALDTVRPDVVLCFNLTGLGVMGILRLLGAASIPNVVFLMDNPFSGAAQHQAEFASFRRTFAVGDDVFAGARVVGCSHGILAEVAAEIGADLTDAVRIPAWVELDQLGSEDLASDRETRFLFASRVAPHKGIEIVVEAASLLRERGQTGFTVDVFGAGLVAQAVQHAHARHVEALVRYRGSKTKAEMLLLYHRYDALLFATWEREPSGFVLSEAAASGCVPIMTATMGGAEYFLDGHDGIKIARTADALAEAMVRMMALTPQQRLAWRHRVRRSVRRMFDAERWYDRLEDILNDAATDIRSPRRSSEGPYQAIALCAHQWSYGRD